MSNEKNREKEVAKLTDIEKELINAFNFVPDEGQVIPVVSSPPIIHIDLRLKSSKEDQTRLNLLANMLVKDKTISTLKRNPLFFSQLHDLGTRHEIQFPSGKTEIISLSHSLKKVMDSSNNQLKYRVIAVGIGKVIRDDTGKIVNHSATLGAGSFGTVKSILSATDKADKSTAPKYDYVLKTEKKPKNTTQSTWLKNKIREVGIIRDIEGECYHFFDPSRLKFHMFMPRITGIELKTLIEEIKTKPISFEEWLTIMKGMLEYLVEIQAKDYIHRDIKPENFMYDKTTRKIRGFDYTFTTKAKDLPYAREKGLGSPLYTSPDALKGRVNRTTDQYSLGAIGGELASFFNPQGISLTFKTRTHDNITKTPLFNRGYNLLENNAKGAGFNVLPGFNFENLNPATIPSIFQNEVKNHLSKMTTALPMNRPKTLHESIAFFDGLHKHYRIIKALERISNEIDQKYPRIEDFKGIQKLTNDHLIWLKFVSLSNPESLKQSQILVNRISIAFQNAKTKHPELRASDSINLFKTRGKNQGRPTQRQILKPLNNNQSPVPIAMEMG